MTELDVEQYGFSGFYFPANTGSSKKAVIILGGSDGTDAVQKTVGAAISQQGIAALGVCYWNRPGLPSQLAEVPVEYIETAVQWLKAQGYEKIGIYGISKGAELALLAASLIPDITCVIALSPAHCVYAGLGVDSKGKKKCRRRFKLYMERSAVPLYRG